MATSVRRLLAVSWAMPPMLFPRSIQVSRALAALAQRGWEVTVLCGEPQPDHPLDPDLAELNTGNLKIMRIAAAPASNETPDHLNQQWFKPAVSAAKTLLARRDFAAIITFAQPWVDHLVGLETRKFTGLPWLAHFSDPWVDSPYYARIERKLLNSWKEMERTVIDQADAVLFTNTQAVDLVMQKYPSAWREKAYVIPHSYDSNLARILLNEAKNQKPATGSTANGSSRLRLVYTGDLYGQRTPMSLLRAMSHLAQKMPLSDQIEAVFIGHTLLQYQRAADELGLTGIVTFQDQMPYLSSLQAAVEADVLLLLDAPSAAPSPFLPSKLVDYLMLGKPILGLTPRQGASADLLQRLECPIVPPDDPPAIENALADLLQAWRSDSLAIPSEFGQVAAAYDMRQVGRLLDDVLRQTLDKGAKHRPAINFCSSQARPEKRLRSVSATSGERNNYASSFGLQWNTFRQTQLDSYTGTNISRDRLTRCLGGSLDVVQGKRVLEAGCGAGRFTELLLAAEARVFACDLSTAVKANHKNCEQYSDYFVCQADIRKLPARSGQFDIVICLGVIQHTPSPEETIASLCVQLKPGGLLVIDHYTDSYPTTLSRRLLRSFLLCTPAGFSFWFGKTLVTILWPLHRLLWQGRRYRGSGRLRRLFLRLSPVVDYHKAYGQLGPELLRTWAILDTHDMLTDVYKHGRSAEEIIACLKACEMEDIETIYAGNGVEARARKPLRPE